MDIKFLTGLQNPLVKHLVKLRNDSKYRYEQQSVIVEGLKPVREIASYIKKLFILDSIPDVYPDIDSKWIISHDIMKKISGMDTSEGVLAEVSMPFFSDLRTKQYILALDGINDPGNLGALLRTALALGWEGVYLLPGCCDLFNEKVLRSARGSHFRIPFAKGSPDDLYQLSIENDLKMFVADLKGSSPEIVAKEKGIILVLGNEAHGASEKVRSLCSAVTIPMPGEMESLNVAVAGGILMYELRKK